MNDEKSECDNQKKEKKLKKRSRKTKLDRAKKGSVTLTPIRVMNCGSRYAHTKSHTSRLTLNLLILFITNNVTPALSLMMSDK